MKTPTFETTRLIIRPIKISDAEDFFEYAKLDYIGPNAGWEPHKDIDYTKEVINDMIYKKRRWEPQNLVMVLKETNKMIGTIELYNFSHNFTCCEIGYSLNPLFHGNGYVTEAAIKILEYGFCVLQLKTIYAEMFIDNLKSKNVAIRIGMDYVGRFPHSYFSYDGKVYDKDRYQISIEKYNSLYNKE